MKYRISDLIMSQNFQGLYAGSPMPEDKEIAKTRILDKVGDMHPDNSSFEDWTDDFWPMRCGLFDTYGNLVLAEIDFDEDLDKERNADWCNVNIMFIYYPKLGETIEEKIEKLLKEKTYKTHACYY
jgi:hypothetical protein